MHEQNIEADPELVKRGTDLLLKQFNEFCQQHQIDAASGLMIWHNAHKVGVSSIATQLDFRIPAERIIRMSDMTWRQAMRQLIAALPVRKSASEQSVSQTRPGSEEETPVR